MGRVFLLAFAALTLSVDAGLPYNWYLSSDLLLRGCDAESTRPAALRSGTPFYFLVLPGVSSDVADCGAVFDIQPVVLSSGLVSYLICILSHTLSYSFHTLSSYSDRGRPWPAWTAPDPGQACPWCV